MGPHAFPAMLRRRLLPRCANLMHTAIWHALTWRALAYISCHDTAFAHIACADMSLHGWGQVESVGLRTVRVRSLDGELTVRAPCGR